MLALKSAADLSLPDYRLLLQTSNDLQIWTTLSTLNGMTAQDRLQVALPAEARFVRLVRGDGSPADTTLDYRLRVTASGEVRIDWTRTSRAEALEFDASLIRAETGGESGVQLYDTARQSFVLNPVAGSALQIQAASTVNTEN